MDSNNSKLNKVVLDKHIKAFKSEIGMLLRFQLAFERISELRHINNITRTDFVDIILSLKALENNTLIRLCKFDDKRKDVHSFHNYLKILPKEDLNYRLITIKVKLFSISIKELKEIRRNDLVAHLKIGKLDNDYTPKYDFIKIIKLVVAIFDLIKKEKVKYLWKDGSLEKFEMRNLLFDTISEE